MFLVLLAVPPATDLDHVLAALTPLPSSSAETVSPESAVTAMSSQGKSAMTATTETAMVAQLLAPSKTATVAQAIPQFVAETLAATVLLTWENNATITTQPVAMVAPPTVWLNKATLALPLYWADPPTVLRDQWPQD